MANDIFFSDDEIDAIKFGAVTAQKVYLGDTLVWPIASDGVLTVSIDNAGLFKSTSAGNYAAIQRSTSGSGSGATFTVTAAVSGIATVVTAVVSIDSAGSGYAVNDTITLDLTSVADGNEKAYAVLEIDSIG